MGGGGCLGQTWNVIWREPIGCIPDLSCIKVDRRADINAKNSEQKTPIDMAKARKVKVDRRADINAKNSAQKTPIDIAKARKEDHGIISCSKIEVYLCTLSVNVHYVHELPRLFSFKVHFRVVLNPNLKETLGFPEHVISENRYWAACAACPQHIKTLDRLSRPALSEKYMSLFFEVGVGQGWV